MTGDFVAFLDADDAWMPDYLETVLQLFQEHDSTLATVTSGWVECPQGNSRESFWRKRGIDEGLHSVTAATEPLILHYMVSYMWPCSTIARTDIVRKYSGFHDKNLRVRRRHHSLAENTAQPSRVLPDAAPCVLSPGVFSAKRQLHAGSSDRAVW